MKSLEKYITEAVTVTKTGELTLNQKVKDEIKKLFPGYTSLEKEHIAAIGYVWFIKAGDKILGKAFKEKGQIVIYDDNRQ